MILIARVRRSDVERGFMTLGVLGVLAMCPGQSRPVVAQSAPKAAGVPQAVFTRDVAPIFQRACQNCHRPGSVAPMSLMTYDDARPWARSIKQRIVAREMPPWYVNRNVGVRQFKNDASLSDDEVATIVNWIDGGAAMGNPADMPPPPQFADQGSWHIKPDLIVSMPQDYTVKAHGPDEMVNFIVDPGFTEDRYVKAIETKPNTDSYAVVHHSNTEILDPGVDSVEESTMLNEYALGKNADVFPEGTGRLLKAGSKILFGVHYHSIGREVKSRSSVGFVLYPKGYVPKHKLITIHVGDNRDLDIRPGEVVRHDGYHRLTRPAQITAFQPHMHDRGKEMCLEALNPTPTSSETSHSPGTDTGRMLSCADFRFGWSISYAYADDVAPLLPAGTILHTMMWHDNTTANRANPDPRNWIGYGARTIDEMSFAWVSLYYLDDDEYQQRVRDRQSQRTQEDR